MDPQRLRASILKPVSTHFSPPPKRARSAGANCTARRRRWRPAARRDAGPLLAQLEPLEQLCGYPGPRLMAQVDECLKAGDGAGLARLTQRISISLLSNSYRDDPEAWKSGEEEDDPHLPKCCRRRAAARRASPTARR